MSKDTWDYLPRKEIAKETAATIAGAAAFGFALTQVFNPVALGIAAAYAGVRTAYGFGSMYFRRDALLKNMIRKGFLEELPSGHSFQKLTDELATTLNKPAHTAFFAKDEMILAILPWYIKPLALIPPARELLLEKTRSKVAAALSTMDCVMASPEFFQTSTPPEIRFVVAHEMSHAKVEDSSHPQMVLKVAKRHMFRALMAGIAVSAGAGLIGMAAAPAVLTAGVSLLKAGTAIFIGGKLANACINYASRIQERRADRNAIYLTRNPLPAIEWLKKAEGGSPKRLPKFLGSGRVDYGFTR